jgi:hypothetical protein
MFMTQHFTVYQRLELPPASLLLLPTPATLRRSDFQQVATVQAATLEETFRLTNHIDAPWWEHLAVKPTRAERFRSTSVGDVIADEADQLWLVQLVGFAQVTWEEEPSPVIEFRVRLRVDDQPTFWRWALEVWRSQWGPREELPELARTIPGIALEALVLSNPTWGSELAIELEDYTSRVIEGHPLSYPDVLTVESVEDDV